MRRRDQLVNAWSRNTPATIMKGAGDMSRIENGAAGVASSTPHSTRLLHPMLMANVPAATSSTPTRSTRIPGLPAMSRKPSLSLKITAASTTSSANVARQLSTVASSPASRKAITIPMACAPPSHPSALALAAPL
jgi:hypothetical protein